MRLPKSLRKRFKNKPLPPAFWKGTAIGLHVVIQSLMRTLHCRMVRYEQSADLVDESFRGPVIYLVYHEYLFLPLFIRHRCNLAVLASQHQDAEVISQLCALGGHRILRGSSSRGGVAILKKMIASGSADGREGASTSLALSPDGPRGPRRVVAPGCIYLSSRLQIPLVPLGIGFDCPWRAKTWDRFAVPKPFSRARMVMGPRIQVPPSIKKEQIISELENIQQIMSELNDYATDWAERKISPPSSECLYRESRETKYQPTQLDSAEAFQLLTTNFS